jgi:hypothetical protein
LSSSDFRATAATGLFSRINGDVTPPRELILRTRFISRGSEDG